MRNPTLTTFISACVDESSCEMRCGKPAWAAFDHQPRNFTLSCDKSLHGPAIHTTRQGVHDAKEVPADLHACLSRFLRHRSDRGKRKRLFAAPSGKGRGH